jgi:hypothetical protein
MKTKNNSLLRIAVMLSVLADGRELTLLVILKRKTLPKQKLPSRITNI